MPKTKEIKRQEAFERNTGDPMPSIMPAEVSQLELAFGGNMAKLLPPYESVPAEFKGHNGKWNNLVSTWFFQGLKNAVWTPKPGIDKDKALRHIKAILGSWEPKHEHKEAGVAYLLSLWFDDVKYERAS